MATYWLSFCDAALPPGQQFLGVVLIDLEDRDLDQRTAIGTVIRTAWLAKANPGGEVQTTRLDPSAMTAEKQTTLAAIPRATLLSRAQLEAYGAL